MVWSPHTSACVASELVDGGLVVDLTQRVGVLAEHAGFPPLLSRVLRRLTEALGDQDWSQLGVLLGVLWYKLDRILSALEQVDRSTQGVGRSNQEVGRELVNAISRLDTLVRSLPQR